MTRTKRALIVFIPLAILFLVFIRWTWVILAAAIIVAAVLALFSLIWSVIEWIETGDWEWF